MKKIILLVMLSLGLFANSYSVGILENDGNAMKSISYSDDDKVIFMDYIFQKTISVDAKTLNKVKSNLTNFVCYDSDLRQYIDKGYKLIVTYMYKNGIDLHYIVSKCK